MRRYLSVVTVLLISSTLLTQADEAIRRAQEALRKRNLYFGDIDGQAHPELVEALKRYQARKGFEPTGELSEETARSLKIELFISKKDSDEALPDIPVLKSDSARELAEPDRAALQPDIEVKPTPAATPAGTGTPSPSVTASDRTADVTAFVRRFLEDAESDDVDRQVRSFAFPVQYFDRGKASREFVVKDTRNYIKRWPQRSYSLVGPVQVTPEGDSGDFQVEFAITFRVSSGARAAHGKTRNLWVIQPNLKNFKILAINEQRLHD